MGIFRCKSWGGRRGIPGWLSGGRPGGRPRTGGSAPPLGLLFLALVLALSLASIALSQTRERYPVDWSKAGPESVEHFINLLRVDTTNPPGNETKAAQYLQSVLAKEGIESKLLALDPDRANLVARIKGNGTKRPVLIMGHTDVVGVQREKWSTDPFSATRKDGYIYGRGATDDKDNVTAGLMLMLLLKRHNVKLDRDIIFLAEAGEESSTRFGIDFLVENHWPEIEAEFALAEGGVTLTRNGKVRYVGVSTAEKVLRSVRLVAHGEAGHGSRPTPDNAVLRLATAVQKLGAWTPQMRLNDTTRAYFERLANISSPEAAQRYRRVADPRYAGEIDSYFAGHELHHYALLRSTVTPTILKAGFRTNVIPSEAEATIDVRTLADEDVEAFYNEMRRVIGDPKVELIPPQRRGRPVSPPTSLDTDMFRAIERTQRAMFPGAITLPTMSTGATDMAQLRAKGVQAYGYGPLVDETDGFGAHSDDERIDERSIPKLVEFLWRAVLDVAVSK
jgi:acetylornithine deacetylase/succinyl-diaminopimelate desuccinylase-like protein